MLRRDEVKNKVILDLCGGTGSWSKPYEDAGYMRYIITLPKYDVTKVDFNTHSLEFIRQDAYCRDSLTILYEDIHGILAAPPCTEFSLAKGAAQRDFSSAMKTVKACLEIIWHCRIHGKPKFWAMENPVGFLRQFIGKPSFTFEQWQFGDFGVKPTDLWGYFVSPTLIVKQKPKDLSTEYPNGRVNGRGMSIPKCPPEYRHLKLNRAAVRAITPSGFAQAFYKSNK